MLGELTKSLCNLNPGSYKTVKAIIKQANLNNPMYENFKPAASL